MIRHIGCTSHLPPRAPAFETGEIELFMCTVNFVERHIYGYEEKVLPEARRRNIGVIAMKVLGGPVPGPGARLVSPEDYQTTLRYVWGVSGVSVAIIGLRTPEELRQALAAARSFKPFDQAEMSMLRTAVSCWPRSGAPCAVPSPDQHRARSAPQTRLSGQPYTMSACPVPDGSPCSVRETSARR
jgi:predicted aldo/keto reductase-like oxidoreductase